MSQSQQAKIRRKVEGFVIYPPPWKFMWKKGSQDKADHVVLFESSDWPKPQRRRSDGGGVGSLEWHNYNKFELATRGKFETLLNNNLPLNLALLILHAFWCTCYLRLIYVEDNVKKGVFRGNYFSVYSFLRFDLRKKVLGLRCVNIFAGVFCLWNRAECRWPL